MDRMNEDEFAESDARLAGSLSDAEPDEADDGELRLTRIAEYQHKVLQKEDPLRAILGAHNAGLLRIAAQFETAIEHALSKPDCDIAQISQLQRTVNVHLNLARQIDRFANLDVRLEEAEQHAQNSKSLRRMGKMQPPTGSSFRRERN